MGQEFAICVVEYLDSTIDDRSVYRLRCCAKYRKKAIGYHRFYRGVGYFCPKILIQGFPPTASPAKPSNTPIAIYIDILSRNRTGSVQNRSHPNNSVKGELAGEKNHRRNRFLYKYLIISILMV